MFVGYCVLQLRYIHLFFFFFSSRRRHTRSLCDWSSDVCSSDLASSARVDELFAAQARRTPRTVAVVSGDEALTYAELDARSDRLAAHLRALGVGPDVLVALFLERSADLVVALLSVL